MAYARRNNKPRLPIKWNLMMKAFGIVSGSILLVFGMIYLVEYHKTIVLIGFFVIMFCFVVLLVYDKLINKED
jgi:Flp pilus assembly protein TadB